MKVAIIGAGNIANVHAKAIKTLDHEIVVVAGKDNSAQAFAKRWGISNIANSISEVLQCDFDIAHICTPPALHYAQIKTLLLEGKHVVSEKPFTLQTDQAEELVQLSEKISVINAVCFNNRYYRAIQEAKNVLTKDTVKLAFGFYLQSFHVLPTSYSWRYDENLAGKMRAVTEIASHWLDLLFYLTGLKVTHVSALFHKDYPIRGMENDMMTDNLNAEKTLQVDSEDSAIIQCRLSNNAIASLVVSETMHGKNNELNIHISGKENAVSWNAENPYRLDFANKEGSHAKTFAFSSAFNETFTDFIGDVYAKIQDKAHSAVFADFKQASYIVAVCNAIYQSANSNGTFFEVKYDY